jgi:hypothetical protein
MHNHVVEVRGDSASGFSYLKANRESTPKPNWTVNISEWKKRKRAWTSGFSMKFKLTAR